MSAHSSTIFIFFYFCVDFVGKLFTWVPVLPEDMFSKYQYVLQRQKIYFRAYVPSENSDQPAHLCSLIRIFTGCI